MGRGKAKTSLDEKIELQKKIVIKAKEKYDAAAEELSKLLKKRNELKNKELLEAFSKSNRSYEEIMTFLKGKSDDSDDES